MCIPHQGGKDDPDYELDVNIDYLLSGILSSRSRVLTSKMIISRGEQAD
jgi:hypothetical protein